MKKIHLFTIPAILIAFVVFSLPVSTFAQYVSTYGTSYPYTTTYPIYDTSTYTPTYTSTYAPTYTSTYNSSAVCTDLSSNLYLGSRDTTTGGQVSALQSFLIAQNYLSAVAPTGYFGASTKNALIQYQVNHDLIGYGYTDAATRLSIRNQSCAGNYGINYNYNNGYQNYNNQYYNNNISYYIAAPVLRSLSTYSGSAGTSVTIYGVSFDYNNNIVHFGNSVITGLSSSNNTSITFTVPQIYNSTYNNVSNIYPITVTTAHGTSNALNFTLTNNGSGYCNGTYYNNYNSYNCYGVTPALSYIYPTSGRVGTQITISGTGFSNYGNNVVHFGNGGTNNISASNGNTIFYTVPSVVSGCDITTSNTYCPMYTQTVTPGTYPISISNGYGQSNTVYFTVIY